jgi:hypothetical protein
MTRPEIFPKILFRTLIRGKQQQTPLVWGWPKNFIRKIWSGGVAFLRAI